MRVRRSALASCILLMAWLSGKSYLQMRSCYAAKYNLDRPNTPSPAQLIAPIAEIERDRNQYLEIQRAYDRKRLRQKLRGQRQPRKADSEILTRAKQAIGAKTNDA